MLRWQIKKIILELKYSWKISRNASTEKSNLVIQVQDDFHIGRGEAAPNVRYNESADELIKQFESFLTLQPEELNSVAELAEYLDRCSVSNALRFAIESAFVHYLCARERRTVSEVLAIPAPSEIHTSFSIPIMDIGSMKDFFEQHRLGRFPFIKLKIDAESGRDAIDYLSRFCSQPLMVDANEAYTDVEECIYFFEKIKKKQIEFIEQPLPSFLKDESVYLKKYSPFRLFADESVVDQADFSLLKQQFDGINVKLMKTGGYLNAVRLLKEAAQQKMQTMIGCMVETTLGISSAMNLCSLTDYADLDSFLLVKDEPYSLVKENNGALLFTKLP